jgi:hypothetical protein
MGRLKMPRRRKTGLWKRIFETVKSVSRGRKAKLQTLVPSEKKVVEGRTYYLAAQQWKAAKAQCVSNPRLAAQLAELYRKLDHPLLLQETREDKHLVEQRQRDRERALDAGLKEVEEVKPRIFVKSLKPEDAANQLLVLGSKTPKPKLRRY